MSEFTVYAKACCPTRHSCFKVDADSEKEARSAGMDYIGSHFNNRTSSKDWHIVGVRPSGDR